MVKLRGNYDNRSNLHGSCSDWMKLQGCTTDPQGIILKSYITITPALHLTLEFPVGTRDMEVTRLQGWLVRRFRPQCSVISHEAGK